MMYFNFGFIPVVPFMRTMSRYCTGQPNWGLWFMNPGRISGNYGGRPQFSTCPEDFTLADVIRVRRAADTCYYNNYFMNSFVSALRQNSYTAVQQHQTNGAAYNLGVSIGNDYAINSGIQVTGSAIASLKNQLEKDIANNQITEEQKEEFKALKKQVEDLETRINQLIQDKNSGSKTAEQLQAELRSISSNNSDIVQKREELVQRINKAQADAKAEAEAKAKAEAEAKAKAEADRLKAEDERIAAEAEALQAKLEADVKAEEAGPDDENKAEQGEDTREDRGNGITKITHPDGSYEFEIDCSKYDGTPLLFSEDDKITYINQK